MIKRLSFGLLFIFLLSCSSFHSQKKSSHNIENYIQAKDVKYNRSAAEAHGTQFGISTQGIYSTQIAQQILNQKGNLIDAFVAASFAIAVERPHSTGLGGGGFFLFHEGKTQKNYALDFRERAPLKSHRDMYLDKDGNYINLLSKDGGLSVGVPGLVRGLWEIHKKFGKLPWRQIVQPSIDLAQKGFPVYTSLAKALESKKDILLKNPAAREIFMKKNSLSADKIDQKFTYSPLIEGDILIQRDLAKTLKIISLTGFKDFYKGQLAKKMAKATQAQQGILSTRDLEQYKPIWRDPVQGRFLNFTVLSMPPPSSGGVHIIQYLNMLEHEPWTISDLNKASTLHYQASALQSAFADRAKYLGDPDFIKIPLKQLLSKEYSQLRQKEIPQDRSRKANEVSAGEADTFKESTETTHLSLMDLDGNAIASTQTINGWMGASFVVPETGIVMNNEMDDFSAKPGTSNLFGAIGGEANAIAPRKTPLSSMSPTLVLDPNKKPMMSVGAPGGTRIISCTAQTIFNYLFFKLPLWESVTNIRHHHQWKPDILFIEAPGPAPHELEKLKKMNYQLEISSIPCRVMSVALQTKEIINSPPQLEFTAVADPRDIGTALAK